MRLISRKYFPAFAAACVHFLLSLIGILHHEIWLDEAHHFVLARDSASLNELFQHTRYEGHPLLWNFLLFVLTRFTQDVFYMQLMHVLIASAAVYVFAAYAPFRWWQKLCVVFGYFFFYEYDLISRNYALALLLLICVCALLAADKKRYYLIFVLLILLAYTHLFALFCAITLFLFVLRDYSSQAGTTRSLLAGALALAFCSGAFLQVIPPEDSPFSTGSELGFSVQKAAMAVSVYFRGLLHFPNPSVHHFWNTNLIADLSGELAALLTVLFFIYPFIVLYDRTIALKLFYYSTFPIVLFIYFSPITTGVRYFGFVFVMFIVSVWVSRIRTFDEHGSLRGLGPFLDKIRSRISGPVIALILAVQAGAAVFAWVREYRFPFSAAKEASGYIQAAGMKDHPVAVWEDQSAPALSAYLQRKVYLPSRDTMGSFCLWNELGREQDPKELFGRMAVHLERIGKDKMVLVMSRAMNIVEAGAATEHKLVIRSEKIVDNAVIKAENCYVYVLEKAE
ncbi:MAG: hypothetical protein AB1458_11595 [Bacteroidota bacterium]